MPTITEERMLAFAFRQRGTAKPDIFCTGPEPTTSEALLYTIEDGYITKFGCTDGPSPYNVPALVPIGPRSPYWDDAVWLANSYNVELRPGVEYFQ